MKLIVLVSGNGSNLQSLIDNNYNVVHVISNRADAYALSRARKAGIKTTTIQFDKNVDTRESYDSHLIYLINTKITRDKSSILIVCAGFMRILSKFFTDYYKNRIINLHPALPGMYPGKDAILQAFNNRKNINYTGIMCHYVDETLDAGKIIQTLKVPIKKNDSITDLKKRIQYFEKKVLMESINKVMDNDVSISFFRHGKVRDLYYVNDDKLLIAHSDRVSSFDRNLGNIPQKGHILAQMTSWWFNRTKDIIPNHLVGIKDAFILANKCEQIPIEFVVRGYITGNTKTSLWTHYKNGSRNYSGNILPEGLVQHQKLSEPILTPTTKGGIGIFADSTDDVPITMEDIVSKNILTQEQLDYIKSKCLELFNLGTEVSASRDLILVDTKYEFGFDKHGQITLIDEVHTYDSSRYWKLSTYDMHMENKTDPDKVDKDMVRDYVKKVVKDPYNSEIPVIPSEIINNVRKTYLDVYENLSGNTSTIFLPFSKVENVSELVPIYRDITNSRKVNIYVMCGSVADKSWAHKIINTVREYVPEATFIESYKSAHKNTREVMDFLDSHKYNFPNNKYINIYITIAGMSNALSGVVACNVNSPVFAIPPFADKVDMLTNINSTLQMPRKVPVMTVLHPINLAMAISRIVNL